MTIKTTIDGQEVIIDNTKKLLQVHIREPFHSAYKQFGWPSKVAGIGINSQIVRVARQYGLDIKTRLGRERDKIYKPKAIMAWGEIYKSYYHSYKRVLIIFPIDLDGRNIQTNLNKFGKK